MFSHEKPHHLHGLYIIYITYTWGRYPHNYIHMHVYCMSDHSLCRDGTWERCFDYPTYTLVQYIYIEAKSKNGRKVKSL